MPTLKLSAERYPAEVFWSDEDEGFIAIAPDLPGCSAWGPDQATALIELQDAIAAWIEAARKAGNPVPQPSRPADPQQFSGKFVLRIPKSLHATLARRARAENVSLNHYAVYLLTSATSLCETSSESMRQTNRPMTRVVTLGDVGTIARQRYFHPSAISMFRSNEVISRIEREPFVYIETSETARDENG